MPRNLLAVLCCLPALMSAQSVPHHVAINPVLASRSALYYHPIESQTAGWRTSVIIDYSNAIETGTTSDRKEYLFDAELMQLDLWVSRDLGDKWFVSGNLPLRSVHDGMLDAFLNWYHDFIGLPVPARNRRPIDTYGWRFMLPEGTTDIARPSPFIGDLRVAVGRRIGAGQLVASVTLPTTTTSIEGWGRGTVGTSLAGAFRVVDNNRVHLDIGAAAGYTPTHGDLAAYQRSTFLSGNAALRWRVIRQQAVFATLFTQSSNWQNTGFAAFDDPEVTLDFGGLITLGANWPTLQLGMTEDLLPRGPSVDAGFRIGLHW